MATVYNFSWKNYFCIISWHLDYTSKINILASTSDGQVDWSDERPSWLLDGDLFFSSSGTPNNDITACCKRERCVYSRKKDIFMDTEQTYLNTVAAPQYHVNWNVKKTHGKFK